jgi:hypothetical protein
MRQRACQQPKARHLRGRNGRHARDLRRARAHAGAQEAMHHQLHPGHGGKAQAGADPRQDPLQRLDRLHLRQDRAQIDIAHRAVDQHAKQQHHHQGHHLLHQHTVQHRALARRRLFLDDAHVAPSGHLTRRWPQKMCIPLTQAAQPDNSEPRRRKFRTNFRGRAPISGL